MKPGLEEAEKHPLGSAPQAKRSFDHVDPFQLKNKGNHGGQREEAGAWRSGDAPPKWACQTRLNLAVSSEHLGFLLFLFSFSFPGK